LRELSTYEEQALLEQLRSGNETAFTLIYKAYWQKMYVIAYKRLGSRQPAEDVVHEVFTSLWRNRESSAVRSLYAYLAAATKYAVFAEVAKQTKHRGTFPTEDALIHDYTIDERFLQKMLGEEINRLPDKCRLVFQYSRQEGLSNKEIAAALSITEKAVEKHITKALSKLRLQLRHLFFFI
jgi:RNA polymerase sigma-70 factor (ECF subfamily)